MRPLALSLGDREYPAPLLDLSEPPECLWWIGDLATLARPCVAIVGTRQATAYGERVTLEVGRDVGIVPGPIDCPKSEGSNLLLRDGAHPIMSAADALSLVGLTPAAHTFINPQEPDQERVWLALREGPADLDTLCHRASL